MDRGPIADFIFKSHTLLRHVSMNTIDNCLKLKQSGIGSSTLSARYKPSKTNSCEHLYVQILDLQGELEMTKTLSLEHSHESLPKAL
jgi:hypothetical protein